MFDMKRALKYILLLVVMSVMVFAFPSWAQEENDQDTVEKSEKQQKIDRLFKMSLEELMDVRITTAGKTSQRIGDIPASVVLITREDIETYGYQTLAEILENIPGLFAIDDYYENGANFGVRGFWSGVPNDNMIILVNDLPQLDDYYSNYPMNKILVPVEAIDRIEVIRGPMSVVYGSGAFYGVINIITDESASDKPVSMVSGSLGSADTGKMFAKVAGREGNYTYSFNGSVYGTSGIDQPLSEMVANPAILPNFGISIDDTTGGKLENSEKFFNFSSTFKNFFFKANYNESKKEFYFAFPSVGEGTTDRIIASQLSFGYKKELSKKVRFEGKLGYFRNRSSFNYSILHEDFYGIQEITSNAWDIELNTFIKPSSKLDISTGFYYRAVLDATNMFDLPSFGAASMENNYTNLAGEDNIVTQAFFTQLTYSPIKNLRVVFGIRLEQSPEYKIEKTQIVGNNTPKKYSALFDEDQVEVIPRLAAIYYLNSNHILKFLYGAAINRPSFAQNTWNSLNEAYPTLEPESIQTLEFNYIGSFSTRFSINASLFRNRLNKLITRQVEFDDDNNYSSWSSNAGEMITNGIELTVNAEPIEYLRFELSGTYQNTEDKRSGFEDIDVAYSPKLLGYLKASYLGIGFKVSVTGSYVGEMETFWDETIENPDGSFGNRIGEKVSGYFLLGANLRFDDLLFDGLFLNVRCSNLLDSTIRYPMFTNNDWARRGTIGWGRTFLISLGYKF